MSKVIVIGAGVGGLTTGVLLAQAGFEVTILEAHTYPGGCAGTFRRKRYRFDAGATLAGGFNKGEVMDRLAKEVGIPGWRAKSTDHAMSVHLDEMTINRYGDDQRWKERRQVFGDQTQSFWNWQERTADVMWDFASHSPPFPPQSSDEFVNLSKTMIKWIARHLSRGLGPGTVRDALLPLITRLKDQPPLFRKFIDGQLLISAQTTAHHANALYSASALDLPRRGVVHFEGGIGTLSVQLQEAFEKNGGGLEFKQNVTHISEQSKGVQVITDKGKTWKADIVVANLTPWDLEDLMKHPPLSLRKLPTYPKTGWGAFMLYVGIDQKHIPENLPLHNQVIGRGPLSEGNSIFISLSPTWDESRAPNGKRAITISTHTRLDKWWRIFDSGKNEYFKLRERYTGKILEQTQQVLPCIKNAELVESGTPLTFNHFTRRKSGWVGGFPQTSLFKTFAPRITDKIWLVGDSIFPGQSTAAVALGGLRVARSIIRDRN